MNREEAEKLLDNVSLVDEGMYTGYDVNEINKLIAQIYDGFEQQLADIQKRIEELEAPNVCSNCEWFITTFGETFCGNAEFEPSTTAETICFMGYQPKDKQ